MFCPKCGNELLEGAVFCGKCGKQLEAQAKASVTLANAEAKESFAAPTKSQSSGKALANPRVLAVVAVVAVMLVGLTVGLFACSGGKASDEGGQEAVSQAVETPGISEDSFFLGEWELVELTER